MRLRAEPFNSVLDDSPLRWKHAPLRWKHAPLR